MVVVVAAVVVAWGMDVNYVHVLLTVLTHRRSHKGSLPSCGYTCNWCCGRRRGQDTGLLLWCLRCHLLLRARPLLGPMFLLGRLLLLNN
ncbi:hypothetical protein GE09DRAFT_1148139, partial [Coniochaeta sp. 2T2.1]